VITAADIGNFYEWLQVRPLQRREGCLSGAMIDHYGYALRTFYSWLQATGQIDHNPMSGLRLPRLGAGQQLPLDLAQIALLFDHARDLRERVLLHLFYSCGLRRSEAEALDISDVSLAQRLLYVRSGKGARRRVVPLAGRVAACLQHYYEGERQPLLHVYDTDSLLLNRVGQRLRGDSMNDMVQAIGVRTQLDAVVTPHRLRHSIATHLLGRGMALEQVRVFLGHGSLDTTQIYARAARDQITAL
jgi:site-specific recombinase XerD